MRVVAFGCSYTYGHGLKDCLDVNGFPGPTPSKLAFSTQLAKKLDCDYVNLGKSGNSNKEIWNDIVNFEFQKNDVAVITWTYYNRFCIIRSDNIRRINPWNDHDKVFYMNYSNRNDMILDFYNRMNHASSYLKNINVKDYNFVIEEFDSQEPKWNKSKILGMFNKIDEAEDNCHPGEKSHLAFANQIYTHIIR